MTGSAVALDPSVRAALEKLIDIAPPPPVSFAPQTWGWAVLAAFVLALVSWGALRWRRRREAGRYRREALAELARIERAAAENPAALAALPPLLKRVALAAWPRPRVAALSRSGWIDFLRATQPAQAVPQPLAVLLDDAEYRRPREFAAPAAGEADGCLGAAKSWIKEHRVSA